LRAPIGSSERFFPRASSKESKKRIQKRPRGLRDVGKKKNAWGKANRWGPLARIRIRPYSAIKGAPPGKGQKREDNERCRERISNGYVAADRKKKVGRGVKTRVLQGRSDGPHHPSK